MRIDENLETPLYNRDGNMTGLETDTRSKLPTRSAISITWYYMYTDWAYGVNVTFLVRFEVDFHSKAFFIPQLFD